MLVFLLILIIIPIQLINTQQQCNNYKHLFYQVNKYNPEFNLLQYTTESIIVNETYKQNILKFKLYDKDTQTNDINQFKISVNSSLYSDIEFIIRPNKFDLTFELDIKGKLNYNINSQHRYIIELIAYDSGIPSRMSKALVYIPLINYNLNSPKYKEPVEIYVAITHDIQKSIGYLNAYDLDGDKVTYSLIGTNDYIKVESNGNLILIKSLEKVSESFNLTIKLDDDGSCCYPSIQPKIIRTSLMFIKIVIVEVNSHSPKFINNIKQNINYCDGYTTFKVNEGEKFEIEIVATDDDRLSSPNSQIEILTPDFDGRVPQNSFFLNTTFKQDGKIRKAIVSNLDIFDYERPLYGSNLMYITYYAKDLGTISRQGYCFISIQIQDINDNVPIFTQNSYTIFINDGYKLRQWSYRFVATDADSGLNGLVDYYILLQDNNNNNNNMLNLNSLFNLDSSTGLLSIKNITYFDSLNDISFNIYAQDRSIHRNRSSIVKVTFIKSKLSMLPPFFADFPNPPEIRNISEMTLRGTILHNFSIILQGDYSSHYLRCFLSPKPSPELFKFEYTNPKPILSKNETCTLSVEDRLNYKQAQSSVIYMVAEVGSQFLPNTARELKTITIYLKEENINAPKFVLSTQDASVVEGDDDLNKTIAVVKAYDLDLEYPFNYITYKIDKYSNMDDYFQIDSATGDIKLIKAIKNKKSLNLRVIASDGAPSYYNPNLPNSNSIYININIIDINDNPPIFINPLSNSPTYVYEFSIDEDSQPSKETIIGTIDVLDQDTESFFNFSISDSTFGVQNIYSPSRSTQIGSNYKGSVNIYLNTYLDYTLIAQVYNCKVYVSDGKYTSIANVKINIKNKNRHAPKFIDQDLYIIKIDENEIPLFTLLKLNAQDDDGDVDFLYKIYSTTYINETWFDLNAKSGELRLKRGLDREADPLSNGIYQVPISVSDLNGLGLTTYGYIKIILNDLNDNSPKPFYLNSQLKQLIITEGQTGSVSFYLNDLDTIQNGKPFVFNLINNIDTNKFNAMRLTCNTNECLNENKELWSIQVLQALNRDEKKEYKLEFEAKDSKGLTTRGILTLVVGDINNNPQESANKQIKLTLLEDQLIPLNSYLGTLFVLDNDDWDLEYKYVQNCQQSPVQDLFSIENYSLKITGPLNNNNNNFPLENMNIKCDVLDKNPNFNLAQSQVNFKIDNLYYSDLLDTSVLRINGIKSVDLVKKRDLINELSLLDKLINEFKLIFELKTGNNDNDNNNDLIKIINIQDVNLIQISSNNLPNEILINSKSELISSDVYFIIRKNTRYISSLQIEYILNNQLEKLKNILQLNNIKILNDNDYCLNKQQQQQQQQENNICPLNLLCKKSFIIPTNNRINTIDANATSLVLLNGQYESSCYCNLEQEQEICLNGGNLVKYTLNGSNKYYCECPLGYEGPKCELLTLTFTPITFSTSHSYAKFKAFELCEATRIEFEFTTDRQKGLLLFNGPINHESLKFIAVEVNNSNLVVHLGNYNIKLDNVKVDDKKWHYVDISIQLNTLQVNLDNCQSSTLIIDNLNELLQFQNQNNAIVVDNNINNLILGGISPEISKQHYYHSYLNVFEYEGCIRNIKINGQLRDLKLKLNEFNLAQEGCDCKYQLKCDLKSSLIVRTSEFPWWIILIIIASLLILAIILSLAVCTIKRKDNQKKILQMFPDDDIRETIINYADGAGEENTENYNIEGMKKRIIIGGSGNRGGTSTSNILIDNLDGRNKRNDGDDDDLEARINDQYLIFANEGEGSDAGSLSSLNTQSTLNDNDQQYNYLKQWGPKFNNLSLLYNN